MPRTNFLSTPVKVYKEASRQVRAIFYCYTDVIEPLLLDEAYLDVTEDKQRIGSAIEIATSIKKP